MYRIVYGIHRGTVTSRDVGEVPAETEAEARKKYDEVCARYQPGTDRFGYVLWFAEIRDQDNKCIARRNGYPYD